jgi:hypothetical protein
MMIIANPSTKEESLLSNKARESEEAFQLAARFSAASSLEKDEDMIIT